MPFLFRYDEGMEHNVGSESGKTRDSYSVRSGIRAVVDDDVAMAIDQFGQYEYLHAQEQSSEESLVDMMADASPNEYQLAENNYGKAEGIRYHRVLGFYHALFAGHVIEGEYRKHGSSGGFGTWILAKLMETGRIDGAVHVRKATGNDGVLFQYDISRSVSEILLGSQSRYYPVELSHVLKTVREMPGRYAIVGIPEFITEIRLLQEIDALFKERIVYTIGLICGHQKSMKYAECLAWQHGIRPGALHDIEFRVKNDAGKSNQYLTRFTGNVDGQKVSFCRTQTELYAASWAYGFFKTKFSDFTDNVFNENADIVLGDAWLPEYVDDQRGDNVIIVRNSELLELINQEMDCGNVQLSALDEETLLRSQGGLVRHREELAYRLERQNKRGNWVPLKRVEPSSKMISFFRKKIQDTRSDMARWSHIHYQEAVRRDDWHYFKKRMWPYVVQYRIFNRLDQLSQKFLWNTRKPYNKKI